MSHAGTPAAEIAIDEALVRELLREQFPDLSHLALHPAASGWDNVMFRLGDALAVRLPRRAAATTALRTEQHWLGRLGALGVDVPVPLRHGAPSSRYPWPWSVVPWLPGHPADERPIEAGEAARLGTILQQLHAPAPPDAPVSPYRGVPLHARATDVEARLGRALADNDALRASSRAIWNAALTAPIDITPRWIHGDLHPRNLLVTNGHLTAIVDWGDLGAGDPAVDLAAFWMLFEDATARRDGFAAYGSITPATMRRASGWALFFGVSLLDAGLVDDARHAATGSATLRRLALSARAGA